MKKAKIKNKLAFILNAVLCVIFAFTIGFTFAASALVYNYGTNPKSATAYLANQQYVVVNDTTTTPIPYSVGVHATEVALEYAIDYSFDLRVKYSLAWSDSSLSTYNVELVFANRDNVIVDENYIYYINYSGNSPVGLTAGEGKISLIAGVEIIETNNSAYLGKTLTISIDEVLIEKQASSYSTSHTLYNSGEAGQAWYAHKQTSSTQTDAYVMVYNYRYNTSSGAVSPGYNSAYTKETTTTTEGQTTISGQWIGGNRAYAGVGAYIITGSKPLKVQAYVTGTWRQTSTDESSSSTSTNAQYDNNIRLNYASNWSGSTYDEDFLFETKDYAYVIPAYSACYITIIDSVEITSAGTDIAINKLDAYRLVVNKITINDELFNYSVETDSYKISHKTIAGSTIAETETVSYYDQEDISVVQTNKYNNSLYEFVVSSATQQSFENSTIALVNNTGSEQKVTVTYNLNYYVSNGSTSLTYTDSNSNTVRATTYSDSAYYRQDETITLDKKDSDSNAYYTASTLAYVLAPYASLNINTIFSVGKNFQTLISEFNRDVWVELNPQISTASETTTGLEVEVTTSGTSGIVKVKNNSQKIINSLTATVNLYSYAISYDTNATTSQPSDWNVSFWKYYTYSDGVYTQNQDKEFKSETDYYKGYYSASGITLTAKSDNVTYSSGVCTVSDLNLKPNESVEILTFTANSSAEILVQATAKEVTSSSANSIVLVNSGVSQNYIINYSENSYIVRFNGTIPTTETYTDVITESGYNYYMFVIRPGQIVKTSTTATAINYVPVDDEFSSSSLTTAGWSTTIVTHFTNYFN